jgi:hypothetical protein
MSKPVDLFAQELLEQTLAPVGKSVTGRIDQRFTR